MSKCWMLCLLLCGCVDEMEPELAEYDSELLTISVAAERSFDTALALVPTGVASRSGNTAFSGAQHLAVWADSRTGSSTIWGARYSTAGAIQETTNAIRISAATGEQSDPVVAAIGARYLVVCEDGGTGLLRAATVTTGGALAQLGSVATGRTDSRPRIAVRGSEALVVFASSGEVWGARYTVAGGLGAPFAIAVGSEPAVAASVNEFLVTYTSGAAPNRKLHGQLVDAFGPVGATIPISVGIREHFASSVGWNGTNFVVAWTWRSISVYGTRVTTTGTVLDTHLEGTVPHGGIPLTVEGSGFSPSVACHAIGTCAVAWGRRNTTTVGFDAYLRTFDGNLAGASAEALVAPTAANQTEPRIAPAGTAFFVAWLDDRDGDGTTAYGSRVSSAGAVIDTAGILLARGYNQQHTPAVARSANNWLVTWMDSRVPGRNILGSRINNGGNVTDTIPLSISSQPATQGNPTMAVAQNGDFVTTWTDHRSGESDIYTTRLAPGGTAVTSAADLPVSTAADLQLRSEIAANATGSQFLVTWHDRRNKAASSEDIYGAIIDATGAVVVADIPICTELGSQVLPRLSFDTTANQWVVVWQDRRSGSYRLYSARVTLTGQVRNTVAIGGAVEQTDHTIVFGSNRSLLVWREGDDLRGTRLSIAADALVVEDPAGIAITSAAGVQKSPTAVFVNDANAHFAVAWADLRTPANGSDLYGVTLFQATGALDGPEYVIANSTEDESAPQFNHGRLRRVASRSEIVLAYVRFVVANATQRARYRVITYNGS